MTRILFFIVLCIALPAKAQTPTFQFPVQCTPGETCWVMNYQDIGPNDKKDTDPTCGPRTYDGHKGTDIALRSKQEMDKGVAVLAARDGKVLRVRNTEPDRFPTKEELKSAQDAKKECGNAVMIEHAPGLQTVYCHLKQNSITVKQNDMVKAGDPIARIGLSGYTEFPHLHFGILWEGAWVDPFTGLNATNTCGTVKNRLWDSSVPLAYEPASIYAAGFSDKVPNLNALDRGEKILESISAASPVLSFWISMFGVQAGDVITLEIKNPDGKIFATRTITQDKTRARQFYYTGRKLSEDVLKPGTYTAHATLVRKKDGVVVLKRAVDRRITVREN